MVPSAAQQQLSQERDRLRLLLEINNAVVTNLSLRDLLIKRVWISKAVVDALCAYPWPGNVRELENFLERSVILSSGTELQAPLAELIGAAPELPTATSPSTPAGRSSLALEEVERRHIVEVLEQTRGVVGGKGGAAEILGLPSSTLRNRMKKLGIR